MAVTWNDASEVVAGKMIRGELSPNATTSDKLMPPFDAVPPLLRKKVGKEEVIEKIGYFAYSAAMNQSKGIEDVSEWVKILERASNRHNLSGVFLKIGDRLSKGEEVDLAVVHKALSKYDAGTKDLILASDIVPDSIPFVETGWKPIDQHVGGIPKYGITGIGGLPGTGKTFAAVKLIKTFSARKKTVIVFSMEMMAQELLQRMIVASIPKKDMKYVWISDEILGPSDVITTVAKYAGNGVDLVIIDFAELMRFGGGGKAEEGMAEVYLSCHYLAKSLRVPTVVLAQFRRSESALPSMQDLRYSGMGEILMSLGLLIYNPNKIFVGQAPSNVLPTLDGWGYFIVGKSRHGTKEGGEVGAIAVPFDPKTGWGDESRWYPMIAS